MKGNQVPGFRPAAGACADAAISRASATNFNKWEVALRRLSLALAVPAIALGVGFSSAAFSQGRTIEETLVVQDPTVAAAGRWLFGGAVEYLYVTGDYDLGDGNGNKLADGKINFGMPGVNLWVGHGDFTVNLAYRKGSGDIDRNWTIGAKSVDKLDQTDAELSLRYLIRSRASITPYVLLGYMQTKFDESETITNFPAFFWSYKGVAGGPTRTTSTTYKSPFIGGGAIFPFGDKFGARADVRLTYTQANVERDDGRSFSGSGIGGGFTATGYYNITQWLNAQLGFRYYSLNGGDIGYKNFMGLFGMLGVTIR
jgi:hypothetical protein